MWLTKQLIIGLVVMTPWLPGCAGFKGGGGFDAYWVNAASPTPQAQAYAYHLAGVMHDRRGEYDQAEAAWKAVNAIDEGAIAPRLLLIRSALRRGDYEQALRLCEESLRQAPDRAELWIVYGELNHRAGRIQAAIDAFKKAIDLRPDDLLGYGALVELQESTNDLVAAIDIYERLIEVSPDSAALYYQLGINLARINDARYARDVFIKVLALEPRISRARYFLGLMLFELGEFARCAEELRRYLDERPGDGTALEYRAGALARQGRFHEARLEFDRLLTEGDAAGRHYVQAAWLLLRRDHLEQAQQSALEGGAPLFADMMLALAQLRNPDEETLPDISWDDRYSLDEVETECDLVISAILGLFGAEEAGAGLLNILDEISVAIGFSPILEYVRARTLLYLERYDDALPTLTAVQASGIHSRHIHYYSAVAYEKMNDFTNTERHLRALLAMDPDDSDTLNFLGYFFAEHDTNLEEAEALLNRALDIDPENPYYLDSLGWIYYRQGKFEEAADLIRRAIYGMDTDDAVLRDHLGDIYLMQGSLDHALAEWRRALRLDPTLDDVREKIERHAPQLRQQ